ncbi:MAG: glycoside hydrolase family 3 C-terminal domain-containing protein, partial [Chitinivibrionales bacterium]
TRVNNIDSLLTQAEKISLLPEREPAISRLGLNAFTYYSEGLHGLGSGGNGGGSYTATQFCQAYGLGETWDVNIMQQAGAQIAHEARASNNAGKFGLLIRAPNADIGRDPRWGRTEECYGEEPFLVGKMAAGLIQGFRGANPKYFMLESMCKHMMANSNEANRMRSSSNFNQRLMMEYYGKSFEIALLEGPAQSYMTAYNQVNGVDCIWNQSIKNMVRHVWKWDGAVCSDDGDLSGSSNPAYTTEAQKCAAAIKYGTISAFDDGSSFGTAPADAITGGYMTITDVDTVIRNTFRIRTRLGDLDPASSVPYKSLTGTPWTSDSAKALARLVTQKSIVLLKNLNNTLPLNKSTIQSIAVIGAIADSVTIDWYGGTPPFKVTPHAGIVSKVGTGVTVTYAADNTNSAAVNAAKASQVAIVFAGNHPTCAAGWGVCSDPSEGKEGIDRTQITLNATQETLIEQVHAANPKTILVLISSFPYAITWEKDSLPAIVHMTHCSEETGDALADVLFGDYNPAGRLTQTWVRALTDLPTMTDYDITKGRTYMYFTGTPLFPFGYGLSYSTFTYANLVTSASNLCQGSINVSVDVTNTGTLAGDEVVQLYVKYPGSAVPRPNKQLRGFSRVNIAAGATTTVTIPLLYKDIAYWDSTQSNWVGENGSIQILVGGSSDSSALTLSKTVSVCSGIVGVIQARSTNGSSGAVFSMTCPMTIERQGASMGIAVTFKSAASCDLSVFDLRGVRVGHASGKLTSGNGYLSLGRTLHAGLYVVSGRINGDEYSKICLVK